jgi:hypothetical protein
MCTLTAEAIMTNVKTNTKPLDVKKEVRHIQAAADKVAESKKDARNFLISTGMYTPTGQIKAQFR